MRPPANASTGYSGHYQAPASHSSSQEAPKDPGTAAASSSQGQGQRSSGGAAEKTEGPISGKPVDFENFWEAPSYLWMPKEVSEREMEAIMVRPVTP